MMLHAIRGTGGSIGTPIVEPLLSTPSAALARAESEFGTTAHDKQKVNITALYRTGLSLGDLVEVHDVSQANSWKGKLLSISHRVDGGTLVSHLTVDRLNV